MLFLSEVNQGGKFKKLMAAVANIRYLCLTLSCCLVFEWECWAISMSTREKGTTGAQNVTKHSHRVVT